MNTLFRLKNNIVNFFKKLINRFTEKESIELEILFPIESFESFPFESFKDTVTQVEIGKLPKQTNIKKLKKSTKNKTVKKPVNKKVKKINNKTIAKKQ